MARKFRDVKVLPGTIDYYIAKTRNIAACVPKYSAYGEQPIPNGLMIMVGHGVSFSSWGEEIQVCLTARGNQTVVDIYSECTMPTQLFDLGKNQENVNVIFNYLMQGAPVQQPVIQPQPQNTGVVICPNCGKQLPSNFRFCNGCGTKVQ